MKKIALIFTLLVALFSFRIAPVSADMVSTGASSFITACYSATGMHITCPNLYSSNSIDYLDVVSGNKVYFDLSSLPSNAIIDSFDVDIKSSQRVGSWSLDFYPHTLGSCNGNSWYGTQHTPFNINSTTGGSYVYDTIHITPQTAGANTPNCGYGAGATTMSWIFATSTYLSTANNFTLASTSDPINGTVKNGLYFVLVGSGSPLSINIDYIQITANYRYDNSAFISRIVGTSTLTNITGNGNPYRMTTGGNYYGQYYLNTDSTKGSVNVYTKVQAKLHDYFTNQDVYLTQDASQNDTYANWSFNSLCTGICANGDTYQLAVRLINDDASVVSGWSGYYYFAYNSYYVPDTNLPTGTLATTTKTNIIDMYFTASTSMMYYSWYVDSNDMPVSLFIEESNDRDGVISNKLIPLSSGSASTTGAIKMPSNPSTSGTTYMMAKLVNSNNTSYVFSQRYITFFLSASSTVPVLTGSSYNANQCLPFNSLIPFNTTFDVLGCLGYIFVPQKDIISGSLTSFASSTLSQLPFIGAFWLTATGTVPIISATIPNGIVGAGAHIDLDVAHSLDFILNATTSSFTNSSASSTQTFYQITSYYWNIIIYLALAFYILSRLLSSHLFGGIGVIGSSSASRPKHFDINDPQKKAMRDNFN